MPILIFESSFQFAHFCIKFLQNRARNHPFLMECSRHMFRHNFGGVSRGGNFVPPPYTHRTLKPQQKRSIPGNANFVSYHGSFLELFCLSRLGFALARGPSAAKRSLGDRPLPPPRPHPCFQPLKLMPLPGGPPLP